MTKRAKNLRSARAVMPWPAAVFLPAFTSAFALCLPETHTKSLSLATVACDLFAGVAGLRRVGGVDLFDSAGRLLLELGNEQSPLGLEDAPAEAGVLARVLPGFAVVPEAERVMALMCRFSTRITSKLRARSVLVF